MKGATAMSGELLELPHDFNPRTREGCDLVISDYIAIWLAISIHAPVKGATRRPMRKEKNMLSFQSTHP